MHMRFRCERTACGALSCHVWMLPGTATNSATASGAIPSPIAACTSSAMPGHWFYHRRWMPHRRRGRVLLRLEYGHWKQLPCLVQLSVHKRRPDASLTSTAVACSSATTLSTTFANTSSSAVSTSMRSG